ncbi:hypothetical protein Acr_21g0002150 [Actinidia rufa]|uniref:Isopenicillin N synthase-like Fe(2+) 2OG dioxygenase domain-containing protein n=1 Tax=Actinidia rufa TaxID=165716 RepID=A0A7J0GFN6_9ERIC|nr:hypothetical protein Acr_21g0002150 [Actinidia rufa]
MRKFWTRVLDLISEGLGIDPGYFEGDLSKIQRLSVNHHIPLPDPSLTLAHPEHYDPNLMCDLSDFQFFKDGQWIGVEPLPSPFMVISNGKFTSPKHRVVTHTKERQTTLGTFFIHSNDAPIIEPATASLSQSNPPLYRSYKYKDFFGGWIKDVTEDAARDCFKVQDYYALIKCLVSVRGCSFVE